MHAPNARRAPQPTTATTDDDDCGAVLSISEDECSRTDFGFDTVEAATCHATIDQYRQFFRCDIDECCTDLEIAGLQWCGQQQNGQKQAGSQKKVHAEPPVIRVKSSDSGYHK